MMYHWIYSTTVCYEISPGQSENIVQEDVSYNWISNNRGSAVFYKIQLIKGDHFSEQKQRVTKYNRNVHVCFVWGANQYLNVIYKQDRQCVFKRNIETRSRNHCCRRKAINIGYSEFVSVALVIQHAKRMRRIILSSVGCLPVPYFSTLSHKRHDLQKKMLLNMKCVFWFSLQLLFETFLILRRNQRDILNLPRSSCKEPVILVRF
jgi:hypothetical protein